MSQETFQDHPEVTSTHKLYINTMDDQLEESVQPDENTMPRNENKTPGNVWLLHLPEQQPKDPDVTSRGNMTL